MVTNSIKSSLNKANSKFEGHRSIWIYFEKEKIKKVLITTDRLSREAFVRKIKKILNRGKSRLSKNNNIMEIEPDLIVDQSPLAVPARSHSKEIDNPSTRKTNVLLMPPVPNSHRSERKKTKEYENKLNSTIRNLKADLHHCRKENSEFRKRIKNLTDKEAVFMKSSKSGKILDENGKKIIQQWPILCEDAIQIFLAEMSIRHSEDFDLIAARVRKINSLIEILEILSQLYWRQKVKWDRVTESEEWFKIRGSKKGHFGDDSRVRIYFHPQDRKLCTYHKSSDERQKKFERNLSKLSK